MNTVEWSPKGTGTVWDKTRTNGLEIAHNEGGVAPWGVWRLRPTGSRYAGTYGTYADCLIKFYARVMELDFYQDTGYPTIYSGDLADS